MSGGTDTLKVANVSKFIPRPLLANSCEVLLSEFGFPKKPSGFGLDSGTHRRYQQPSECEY